MNSRVTGGYYLAEPDENIWNYAPDFDNNYGVEGEES
jgi:hypothetical protein